MSELPLHDQSILSPEVSDMVDESFMVSSNLVKYNISLSQIKQRVGILSKLYMLQNGGMNSLEFCDTVDSGCARASTTVTRNERLSRHVRVSKVENVIEPQTNGIDPSSLTTSNFCESNECNSYAVCSENGGRPCFSTVADATVSTIIESDEDSTSESHHSFYTIAGTSSQNIYDNLCSIEATTYHTMSDSSSPATAGLSSSTATNLILPADFSNFSEVEANNKFHSKNNLSTIKSSGCSAVFDVNPSSNDAPVDAAYSSCLVGPNRSTFTAANLSSPTVAKTSTSDHANISILDSSRCNSAATDKTFEKQDSLSIVKWDMLPLDLQERVRACEAALQLQPPASCITDVYARQHAIEERLLALSSASSISCSSCYRRGHEDEGKDEQEYDNLRTDIPFEDDDVHPEEDDDFQVEQNDSEEEEEEFDGKDMTLEDIDEEIWMLEAKIKEKELRKRFGNEEHK